MYTVKILKKYDTTTAEGQEKYHKITKNKEKLPITNVMLLFFW